MTTLSIRRVEWAITSACDLRCRHCYAHRRDSESDLTRAEALDVVEQLRDARCSVVTLSGGEPLLHPHWDEIALSLRRRGIIVQVVSNGQSIDSSVARALRESGVAAVFLSLDGKAATHDGIRRKAGAFDRVMSASEHLRREGVPIGFLTTLLRPNAGELESLAAITRDAGSVIWQVWLGMPMDDSALWIRSRDLPSVENGLMRAGRINGALVMGDNLGYFGATERFRRGDGLEGGTWRGCEAGRSVLGIRSDGRITGCLALPPGQDEGSLRSERLAVLWQAAAERNAARSRSLSRDGCGRCRRGATCRGGCHATALSMRGDGPMDNVACMTRHANVRPNRGTETVVAAGAMLATIVLSGCHSAEPAPPESPVRAAPTQPEGRVVTVPAAPAEQPLTDPENAEPVPEPVEDVPEPVGPSNANRQMPSCCMAHVLLPNCRCGGPPIPPDGGP